MRLVLCALSLCGTAFAEEQAPTPLGDAEAAMFSISGFGTAGLAHSSEHKADFMATDLQRHGVGYSRKWSTEVDSRAGVQLTGRFTPELTGVLQVTSEQRSDGSYDPKVEWANLKYQVTPDLSIRAGRIVLPTFILSDSRKVGYASPWVRPPVEVYGLVPLTRSDGVDISYRKRLGEVTNTVQLSYGESSAQVPSEGKVNSVGGEVTGKNAWGIIDTLEYGNATLRLSYIKADLTITPYKTLFDAYRQFGALGLSQANAIAEKYDPDNKPFYTLAVGASYDPGRWFVMGEWGVISTDSVYGKRSAWYVTSGYRFGKFTPYVSYAQARLNSNASDPGLSLAYVPPAYRTTAAYLNGELNEQLGAAPVQKTISLGMRWDFAKNVALDFVF
ncbi:MAG: hypothetical protein VB032_03985 [Burkholderiaceae bacterium]|nr:hypothetical protein [Burkholderiaceae bacterium]